MQEVEKISGTMGTVGVWSKLADLILHIYCFMFKTILKKSGSMLSR